MQERISYQIIEETSTSLLHIGTDKINSRILRMLRNSSNVTFSDIVEELGLSESAISKRLNKLYSNGFINWNRGSGITGPGRIRLTSYGKAFLRLLENFHSRTSKELEKLGYKIVSIE